MTVAKFAQLGKVEQGPADPVHTVGQQGTPLVIRSIDLPLFLA